LEPEDVTIKGLITGLSAKDSPLILDTSRMVNIKWFEEAEGKTYEATAILDREDYYKAIKAHEEWKSVEITGKLKQEKQNWKFISYTKFNVLA
jgi:hypothetical protein